jgi:hypothetical protein
MVVYVGDFEEVRIQEIDEDNDDYRIGVYDEGYPRLKGNYLIKIFHAGTKFSVVEKFAEKYYQKHFNRWTEKIGQNTRI